MLMLIATAAQGIQIPQDLAWEWDVRQVCYLAGDGAPPAFVERCRLLRAGVIPTEPMRSRRADAKPRGYPQDWFDQKLLSPEVRSLAGTVGIDLSIDRTGTPTRCTVYLRSAHPALDDATCSLAMQRARFSPATTPLGLAVAGTYRIKKITWVPTRQ